jgi:hypothetical protein
VSVRVMLEWFGRRQTIALSINSVVGCLIATILLMISSENKPDASNPPLSYHWRWTAGVGRVLAYSQEIPQIFGHTAGVFYYYSRTPKSNARAEPSVSAHY